MTNDSREELDGLLAAAVREMNAAGQGEPPADLNDALLKQFRDGAPPQVHRTLTKNSRFRMIMKFSLAASLLAVVAGVIGVLVIPSSQGALYAQVSERIERLHAFVCHVQWVEEKNLERIDRTAGQKVTFLAPSRHRIDDPAGRVILLDTRAKKEIHLITARKEALVIEGENVRQMESLSPVPIAQVLQDHFRQERAGGAGIEKLGQRKIGGAEAVGLRSTLNGQIVEAWVDPISYLPVEVRVRLAIPAHAAGGKLVVMWHVITNFQYDVEIDEKLMALEVPPGYTQITMPEIAIDRSPPGLDDLIALLRICAEHNDSEFPQSLSMNDDEGTCMAIMKHYVARLEKEFAAGTEEDQQDGLQKVTRFGTALGRGMALLNSLTPENDVRYFPGARLDEPTRPLLWYSPDADGKYKVVYADLSVADVLKGKLPAEPAPATTTRSPGPPPSPKKPPQP